MHKITKKRRTYTCEVCGFFDQAKGHTGSFTTGSGTYCSTCHQRIYNPNFDGPDKKKAWEKVSE